MQVTQSTLNWDDFVWYDGHCELDFSEGVWNFYQTTTPDTMVETVTLNWEYASETDRSLVFENVKTGSSSIGDQLTYAVDGDSTRMEYFDASTGITSKIVWNTETAAGYIYMPNYNNGQLAYWDENHQDVVP